MRSLLAKLSVVVGILLGAASLVFPQSSAEWEQIKADCRSRGGTICDIYNDCNGVCTMRNASPSPTSLTVPAGLTPQQQLGLAIGQAAMPILQQAIHDLFFGSPDANRNSAEAERQQQLLQQQLVDEQIERERLRRIAEQQRLDAMFARLNGQLKLEGLPFTLALKAMDTNTGLELKSMNSSGPDALKLKLGPSSATSYGLKGLPGIYVGGPAGSDATPSQATPGEAGGNTPSSSPNLVSGPGSGRTGEGIPGLPGIYLDAVDAVRPDQAAQLAQAANNLSGPEQTLAQDVALQAAEKNPAFAGPSEDPKVEAFQQTAQEYHQAADEANTAQKGWNESQSRAEGDKSLIELARSKVDLATATPAQQEAFNKMLTAATSDEAAAEAARKIFESANATLSVTRGKAASSLAQLAPASNPSPGGTIVDLSKARPSAPVANLKTPMASASMSKTEETAQATASKATPPDSAQLAQAPGHPIFDCVGDAAAINRLVSGLPAQQETLRRSEAALSAATEDAQHDSAEAREKWTVAAVKMLNSQATSISNSSEALLARQEGLKATGISADAAARFKWLQNLKRIAELSNDLADATKLPQSYRAGNAFGNAVFVQQTAHDLSDQIDATKKLVADAGIRDEVLETGGAKLSGVLWGPIGEAGFKGLVTGLDLLAASMQAGSSAAEADRAAQNLEVMRSQYSRIQDRIYELKQEIAQSCGSSLR